MEFEDYLKIERDLREKLAEDASRVQGVRRERRYTREELRKRRTARIILIVLFFGFALLAVVLCTTSAASEDSNETFADTRTDSEIEAELQVVNQIFEDAMVLENQRIFEENCRISDQFYEDFKELGAVDVEVDLDQEDFENEKIEAALLARAHVIENCTITYYCSERYPHICGTGDGVTASGREVRPYISCAVDKNIIPLGSTVMVDYGDGDLHYYVADDIGCWVKGSHVDLAVTTHKEAEGLGIKTATVYWCEEGDQ